MGRNFLLLILFVAVALILGGCTTNENVENKPFNIQVVATPSEGYQPLEVLFSVDMTSIDGTIQSILWNFGDGTTSTEVSPSHTFSAGTYNVVVDVTSDKGIHYHGNVTVYVYNYAPTVTISASPLSGKAPLQVQFKAFANDSDGQIVSYLWSFGDGSTSSLQNPTHTYTSIGTFNVSLIVTDNDGATAKDTITIKVMSNVPPTAEILASTTKGTAPLTVHFEGKGIDEDGQIISYFWDFGDGETSTEQNPTHTYPSSGTYTVTLTVTDDSGASSTATLTIVVERSPITFKGTGDTVTESFTLEKGIAIFHMHHTGYSNFIIWLYNADTGEREELLVNEIGSYDGSTLLGVTSGYLGDVSEGNYILEITADGSWEVDIEQPLVKEATEPPISLSGNGDSVPPPFVLDSGLVTFHMHHTGYSNFIIWLYNADGEREELLVNEIGSYDGSTLVSVSNAWTAEAKPGIHYLKITADGSWQVDITATK